MIWQFGELGYDYSINYCVNGTINSNCRLDQKPIRWDYLQQIRRKRLYDIYSSLLKLRFHPAYKNAFISNRVDKDLAGPIKWIKVTTDTSNLLVIGNFDVTQKSSTVSFQNAGTWYDYLDSSTITATGSAQNITLQPGEYHLYLNRNIINAVTTPVSNIIGPGNKLQMKMYPNPVQTNSYLEINVPESGVVEIDLYNTIGQKILTLHNGFLIKGNHKLFFTNKNKNLAAGSYLLSVHAKNNSGSIKIVLQ
jgi:hypothetical protein